MSLPFFPMYPSDFEADTSHLTLEEDGAYNRLLRLMWMTNGCSLPNDDAWIARRMRVDMETFDRVIRGLLEEFFISSNGRVSNARLSEISEESNAAHKRRVEAGSKGGKVKPLKTKGSTPSNAEAKPKQPQPQPQPYIDTNVSKSVSFEDAPEPKPKKSKRSASKPKAPISKDWKPTDENRAYASDKFAEARRCRRPDEPQVDPPNIDEMAENFRDYWRSKGEKRADWSASWQMWVRNQIKFEKERKLKEQANGTSNGGQTGQLYGGKNSNMQSSFEAIDAAADRRLGY